MLRKSSTLAKVFVLSCVVLTLGLLYAAFSMMPTLWGTPDHRPLYYFQACLYWLSWLMVPMILLGLWLLARSELAWLKVCAACCLLPLFLLSYGRFIEPNLLVVEHSSMRAPFKLKIALIADVHVGIYSSQRQLEHLVDQLNALDVDEVWVAGDWTHLAPLDMKQAFAALGRLRHPMLSVPGNHDAGRPGPPLQNELTQTLDSYGVQTLKNQVLDRGDYRVVGLGSAWAFEAFFHLVESGKTNKPTLVLAHNPDVVNFYPNTAFLTLTGHTHGGQVDLPWFTQQVLNDATMAGVDEGWYKTPGGTLFVTRGIGMVGLPVRFFNIPVIDVIELSPDANMPRLQNAMNPKGRFKGW